MSVVADKHDPATLMVRARRRQDLVNAFGPECNIVETPDADYRWRTFISRGTFQNIANGWIDGITYANFKDSVEDPALHDMYLDFWVRHRRYQEQDRSGKR